MAAPGKLTVRGIANLLRSGGVRVLIVERDHHLAGAGTGQWRAARAPKPDASLDGVHAATVEHVGRVPGTVRLHNVVTNLVVVQGVTAGQVFRLAGDGMEDTAVIRARSGADRDAREASLTDERTHPRDVDGNRVAPGDLVELVAGRYGTPGVVTRALRPACAGGLIVPRPLNAPYGEMGAGEGLALSFRRLPDTAAAPGGYAWRSCGCLAQVRDAIVAPPARRGGQLAEQRTGNRPDPHMEGCHWWRLERSAPTGLRVVRVAHGELSAVVVHSYTAPGSISEPCACSPFGRYDGDFLYAVDRVGVILTLFPTRAHPGPGVVEFAPCVRLPEQDLTGVPAHYPQPSAHTAPVAA